MLFPHRSENGAESRVLLTMGALTALTVHPMMTQLHQPVLTKGRGQGQEGQSILVPGDTKTSVLRQNVTSSQLKKKVSHSAIRTSAGLLTDYMGIGRKSMWNKKIKIIQILKK